MRDCTAKSTRKSLESAFSDVMAIDAAQTVYVQSNPSVHSKSLKKLSHELSIEFADALCGKTHIIDKKGTP